ncbi:MAG: TraB/GumN family protein [Prevotellaceae bacterium]|nr:TraB/GumN family protein [Prevotellaceae bacterium]
MRKLMFTLLLVTAAAVGANAQLLYRISGNGLSQDSYIVGTFHIAPVSFADSISGVYDALNNTEQVCGELDMTEMMNPEKLMNMQKAMMLGDGATLSTLLNEEQLAKLNSTLNKLMGADLTNPMVKMQLDNITPAALETQLSLLMALKHSPDFDMTNPFDGYFQKLAQQEGKPVKGLETLDFQTETLYKGTSMERQMERLMCLCDNYDYMYMLAERLAKAYYTQNLDSIKEVMDEKLNTSCDATDEENDRLIYNRNRNWLAQMPMIMKQKPTFFAVGAAHLVGEKGVIEGLRKAGYTVTGVK